MSLSTGSYKTEQVKNDVAWANSLLLSTWFCGATCVREGERKAIDLGSEGLVKEHHQLSLAQKQSWHCF